MIMAALADGDDQYTPCTILPNTLSLLFLGNWRRRGGCRGGIRDGFYEEYFRRDGFPRNGRRVGGNVRRSGLGGGSGLGGCILAGGC